MVAKVFAKWVTVALLSRTMLSEGLYARPSGPQRQRTEPPYNEYACNEVLTTWTKSEIPPLVVDVMERESPDYLDDIFSFPEFNFEVLEGLGVAVPLAVPLILPLFVLHGVQVRKVCGSCADIDISSEKFFDFCGPDNYGSDTTFSGLLMLPLDDNGSILAGTMKGLFYNHVTVARDVPSTQWVGAASPIDLFLAVTAASNGNVVICPDYMGYGESVGKIFKGYLIKKAYQTSIVPLWYRTEQILAEETNCRSALADAAGLIGYSEGGYAVFPVASALRSLGIDIIQVNSGAPPLRIASATLLKIFESVEEGRFPSKYIFFLLILGAAYSTSYKDLANYGQGQDLLASDVRDAVVDLIAQASTESTLLSFVPKDDPLKVYNPDLLDWAREAQADGDSDPCRNPARVVPGFNDKFCQAVIDNDLVDLAESSPYPVTFCQSMGDNMVDISSLPDLSKNSLLSFRLSIGSHENAGAICLILGIIFDFLANARFQNYKYADKHSPLGCQESALFAEFPLLSELSALFP